MPSEPIITHAEVTELRDHRTVLLKLKNGKITLGHLPKAQIELMASLAPGTHVEVEMTPFDFEKARISQVLSQ